MRDPRAMVMVVVAACGLGAFVVRQVTVMWTKWLESKRPQLPTDLEQRLARIEQAVDAIAIETERASEAHRYLARVLSERGLPTLPAPRRESGSITPH